MIKVNHIGFDVTGKNYEQVCRTKGSGDYLMIFAISSLDVCLENEIAVAAPSAVVIFKPGQKQEFSAVRDYRLSYVHFSASSAEMERFKVPMGQVFYPKNPELVQQFIEQIFREYYTKEALYEDEIDSLLRNLFVSISRDYVKAEKEEVSNSSLYPLFCEARFTMLSNCEKEWASTNMCQMVSLSRSQFYKYYDEFFGLSPMADINIARIEKAKVLLTNEKNTVTEVAALCGYQSIHHFSRTFKEHTGVSPLQYVKAVTGR